MVRVLLLLLCGWSLIGHGVAYKVRDLGLWEHGDSSAWAINDRGDVIGIVQMERSRKCFFWNEKDGLKIIDDIPKGALPVAINNKGQVIGHFYKVHGWWTLTNMLHAFIWDADKEDFTDIGALDGLHTAGVALNEKGQVVAIASDDQCYLWDDGNEEKLEEASHVIQGDDVVCARLNNDEMIFAKRDPSDKKSTGGLYSMDLKTKKTKRIFETIKETPYLSGLTKSGKMCGFFMKGSKKEAFLAGKEGTLTTVKDFHPFSMNEKGMMVGLIYHDGASHGGVYIDGKAMDINDLLLPAEEQPFAIDEIVSLRGVNAEGWAVGVVRCGMKKQAVLLIPEERS